MHGTMNVKFVKQYLYRHITGPEGARRMKLPDFKTIST
jgi:hypothetical protein